MKLASQIDFRQIALDSGLTDGQAETFAKGLTQKNTTETIELPRAPYTELQKNFEAAILELLESLPPEQRFHPITSDPPFAYRTPKLLTPIHNPDHPRADIIQRMIIPEQGPPLAYITCSEPGIESIKNLPHMQQLQAIERVMQMLTIPQNQVDPFSFDPKDSSEIKFGSPDDTYMASYEIGDIRPTTFEAAQMPELKNDTAGIVRFSEAAVLNFSHARYQHQLNQTANRTSQAIRKILFNQ